MPPSTSTTRSGRDVVAQPVASRDHRFDMTRLDVSASIEIHRDHATVRRQFADVAHHERSGVHRGVEFEVIADDGNLCRYRQTTRLGPLRLHQELQLARTDEGPLVNTVLNGQFHGGTISFDIQPAPADDGCVHVHARLVTELHGASKLAAPLLRRSIRRSLGRALAEDKRDLEQHGYGLVDGVPT